MDNQLVDTNKKVELKPCPFCGNNDLFVRLGVVNCEFCIQNIKSPKWNNRPIEDRLTAKLADANARVEELENIPSVKKILEFEKEIGAVLPDLLMRLHQAQMLQEKHPSEGN